VTLPPLMNSDPGDESAHQLTFPMPRQPVCKACGARAKNLCEYEADRANGLIYTGRPRSCIARYDPATSEWPPGFGEAA
jgi:hypothetical protein